MMENAKRAKEKNVSGDKIKAVVKGWADQIAGRIICHRFIPLSLRPDALVPDSIDRNPD